MPRCRVAIVSTNKMGHINQCQALCAALDWVPATVVKIDGRSRSDGLVTFLQAWRTARHQRRGAVALLSEMRPDMLICSGAATEVFGALSSSFMPAGGKSIFIGCPSGTRPIFDIAVASTHEQSTADVTARLPAAHHSVWMDGVPVSAIHNDASGPAAVVLLGGTNKAYEFTAAALIPQLQKLKENCGMLSLAFSRRTPADVENEIRKAFDDNSARLIDRNDREAYLQMLATAKNLFVTPDSISMTCETLATGRPVTILDLPVKNRDTPTYRFVRRFVDMGHVKLFTDPNPAEPIPWSATQDVARTIKLLLRERACQ